jgi:hypothetical protein
MPALESLPAKDVCPGEYHEYRVAPMVAIAPFLRREYERLLEVSGWALKHEP